MGLAHNSRRVKSGLRGLRGVAPPCHYPDRMQTENVLEALQPDLVALSPALAAGPFLIGNWPLFLLIGLAAMPA